MKTLLATLLCLLATTATATDVYTLEKGKYISLTDVVSNDSTNAAIYQLLSSKGDEVTMFISSPGGSIIAGLNLIQAMKASGKTITCIADFAASMAFIILQNCDKRLVTPNAVVMQHEASFGARGARPHVNSMVDFVNRMVATIEVQQAERIGMSLEDFKAKARNDWWLFGKEAIDNGVADSLTFVSCSTELLNKLVKKTARSFFGSKTYTASACPLIKGSFKGLSSETIKNMNSLTGTPDVR